ncbi:hypothetical protein J2X98_000462 [Pseudarthrobacter enclensis]|uniref:DUF1206 domain-containing protein n=1 Tax=Pseudarthrobacter enclensis TaxID=993070 RepID=A0ABT9RNT2_9MICC|nr:hypothetical protein [Pseudarthrobacter enclensis]
MGIPPHGLGIARKLLPTRPAWDDWPCRKGTHASALPRLSKGKTIKEELKQVVDKAEDVTNSRVLEFLARAGFAVSGILHLLVGAIAVRLAMGGTGHADFSGAVAELATMPVGPFLLWGSFAACSALSLWQAGDAIFDFNHQATKKKVKNKAKAALQAIVYGVLALTLWHFAMGTGTGNDNGKATSDFTISMMGAPGGVAVLVVIGLAVAVTGVAYGMRGPKRSFEKQLRMPAAAAAKKAVLSLGIAGYLAKGLVLLLTGLLIVIATIKAHPEDSTGLDGGLRALRDQPMGPYLLAAVGAGLVCYGAYMIMRARLAKMTR